MLVLIICIMSYSNNTESKKYSSKPVGTYVSVYISSPTGKITSQPSDN